MDNKPNETETNPIFDYKEYRFTVDTRYSEFRHREFPILLHRTYIYVWCSGSCTEGHELVFSLELLESGKLCVDDWEYHFCASVREAIDDALNQDPKIKEILLYNIETENKEYQYYKNKQAIEANKQNQIKQ